MNEILATYSLEIIKAVVLAILAIIGVYAAKLQTKYIDTDTKRKIAATTVAYIEQVYKDLHGACARPCCRGIDAVAEGHQNNGGGTESTAGGCGQGNE